MSDDRRLGFIEIAEVSKIIFGLTLILLIAFLVVLPPSYIWFSPNRIIKILLWHIHLFEGVVFFFVMFYGELTKFILALQFFLSLGYSSRVFSLQLFQLYCQVNLSHLEVRFQFPFDSLVLIILVPVHRLNFFLWVHAHQVSQTIQILSSGCLEYQGLDCLVIPLLRTPPSQSHLPPVEAD